MNLLQPLKPPVLLLPVILAFVATAWTQAKPQSKRGSSTPQERANVIRLAHQLEREPLGKDAKDVRAALMTWLIEVPDIHVTACDLVPDLLKSKRNYATELFGQVVISSGAFVAEYPDLSEDYLLVNTAGLEGMLTAYEAVLKEHPESRWPVLDELLKKRPQGELPAYAGDATTKCGEKLLTENAGDEQRVKLAGAHLRRGNKFFDAGQYDLALIEYRRALELVPDQHQAYHELSQTFYHLKNFDKAIEYANRAIQLEPKCWLCYQSLGNTYDDSGKPEEALNFYRKASEVAPDKGQPLYNYAVTLQRLDRIPDAIAALEKAIAIEPKYASPYRLLGNILNKRGDLYPAEAQYRKFMELESSGERYEKVKDLLTPHVHLDPVRLREKSPQVKAYGQYGVVRANWMVDGYRKQNPSATQYFPTAEEEIEALTQESKAWQETKKAAPGAKDEDLDRLLRIYAAGNLDPFVYSYWGQKSPDVLAKWKADHPDELAAFQKWAAENAVSTQPIRQAATVEWLGFTR